MSAPVWSPLLLALFVYPLLEELVFRYGLLAWLDGRLSDRSKYLARRKWTHNAAVRVVFAAAHALFNPTLTGASHAVLVFFPSLVLGYVWQRYENLWLCVALHGAMNGVYLLATIY